MPWEMITATVSATGLVAAVVGLYVRSAVRAALAEFETRLMAQLNGRYVYRREWEIWLQHHHREEEASHNPS